MERIASNQNKQLSITEAFKEAGNLLTASIQSQESGLTPEQREFYKLNPILFAKDILGVDLYSRQEEVMCAVRDFERTAVASAHGVGKSFVAAIIVLWFITCFCPSTVITTAPTARQVKDILWKEIAAGYYRSKIPLGGRMLSQDLIMSDKQKWFATGFTTTKFNLDRFQGFHNTNILVVLDEACGVAQSLYNAFEGLLSAGAVIRLLLIGNPSDSATEFGKAFREDSLYHKFHLSVFDEPNFYTFGITLDDIKKNTWQEKITGPLPRTYLSVPKWAAERYAAWGEDNPLFQVKIMGNFPIINANRFIPLNWIERAIAKDEVEAGEKIIGVDIAREGDDESVLCIRDGNVVKPFLVWNHLDTMQSVNRIAAILDLEKPSKIFVDSVGVGGGIYDRLKELGYAVIPLNGGERAYEETYYNSRSEMYWGVRKALEADALILPDDDILTNEMLNIEYSFTVKNKFRVEPKDETKKRLGKSPDRFDALAATFFSKPAEGMTVAGSLGGIFNKDSQRAEVSQEWDDILAKAWSPMGDPNSALYKKIDFSYNKPKVYECPICKNAAGLVFMSGFDMVSDKKLATNVKCLICNEKSEVKDATVDSE